MDQPDPRRRKLSPSPLLVFAVLITLVGVIVIAVAVSGGLDGEPTPAPAPVPTGAVESPGDTSLTNAEAIARFQELDALRLRAFETRDLSLLDRVFTSDSPAADRLRKSIRTLKRERAFADEQLRVLSVVVTKNTPSEITIRQVSLLDIRFEDALGNDVTKSGGLERQRIRWTLRPEGPGGDPWLVYEGTITSTRPVKH